MPLLVAPAWAAAPKRPHVVFLLADDLGWKDVGYHASEIKTPNLDRISVAGARLEQFYVMPVCSPTRCCLMTGRYPMRTGLQSGVVRPWAQYGLPLDERTLAQALKEAGYVTAITGKWHLGHFEPEYLPTRRGFDHQYGHYNGAIDYFDHTREGGLDWHRDDKVLREEGYSTNLIGAEAVRLIKGHDPKTPLFLYVPFNAPHTPLQAPEEYLKKYADIKDMQRRKYAAMVTCLDDAVGRIEAALKEPRSARQHADRLFQRQRRADELRRGQRRAARGEGLAVRGRRARAGVRGVAGQDQGWFYRRGAVAHGGLVSHAAQARRAASWSRSTRSTARTCGRRSRKASRRRTLRF